ncbi:hypothetical protein LTR95_004290 [Oleoguttula sp. CCFEE 5521]
MIDVEESRPSSADTVLFRKGDPNLVVRQHGYTVLKIRTRPHVRSEVKCTMHMHYQGEPSIAMLAVQHQCKDHQILANLSSGLPKLIHPAFDLDLADVLGTVAKSNTELERKPGQTQILGNAGQASFSGLAPASMHADLARDRAMQAVRPAFRLASAILTQPDQLPYWHDIWRAEQEVPPNWGLCTGGTFDARRSLGLTDQADTLDFLDDLGQGTIITFEDLGSTWGQCFYPPALVRPNSKLMRNWMREPRLPHDRRPQQYARVKLSMPHYMEPCLRWREMTVPQLHALWFRLAKTILHELAHAATRFAFRHTYNGRGRIGEPFFRDEAAAEVGKAYENYIFGGYIESPAGHNVSIRLGDWPSEGMQRAYSRNGKRGLPTRGPLAAEENLCNVPVEHLSRLFRCSFWSPTKAGVARPRLRMGPCYPTFDKRRATDDVAESMGHRNKKLRLERYAGLMLQRRTLVRRSAIVD